MSDENAIAPVDHQPLDPRTVEQLVLNQTRELELRARELDLQQQQDRHNFEFSKSALEAQTQDRQDERRFQLRQKRNSYMLAGWITLAVFAVIGSAMWFNKDQVALEIIKSIVLLLSGGGTGYALGRHHSKKSLPSSDED